MNNSGKSQNSFLINSAISLPSTERSIFCFNETKSSESLMEIENIPAVERKNFNDLGFEALLIEMLFAGRLDYGACPEVFEDLRISLADPDLPNKVRHKQSKEKSDATDRVDQLSENELAYLSLIMQGQSDKEASKSLNWPLAKTHEIRRQLLKNLNAQSVVDAVRIGILSDLF